MHGRGDDLTVERREKEARTALEPRTRTSGRPAPAVERSPRTRPRAARPGTSAFPRRRPVRPGSPDRRRRDPRMPRATRSRRARRAARPPRSSPSARGRRGSSRGAMRAAAERAGPGSPRRQAREPGAAAVFGRWGGSGADERARAQDRLDRERDGRGPGVVEGRPHGQRPDRELQSLGVVDPQRRLGPPGRAERDPDDRAGVLLRRRWLARAPTRRRRRASGWGRAFARPSGSRARARPPAPRRREGRRRSPRRALRERARGT